MKNVLKPLTSLSFVMLMLLAIPTLAQDKAYEIKDVDQLPSYENQDLNTVLVSHISENLVYPESSMDEKKEGRVFVSFQISKTGEVENVEVLRGVSEELDQAAKDIVASLPVFSPAKMKDKAVRVQYTIPIHFKLD